MAKVASHGPVGHCRAWVVAIRWAPCVAASRCSGSFGARGSVPRNDGREAGAEKQKQYYMDISMIYLVFLRFFLSICKCITDIPKDSDVLQIIKGSS